LARVLPSLYEIGSVEERNFQLVTKSTSNFPSTKLNVCHVLISFQFTGAPVRERRASRIDCLSVCIPSSGHTKHLSTLAPRHVSLSQSRNLIYSTWRWKIKWRFSKQLLLLI